MNPTAASIAIGTMAGILAPACTPREPTCDFVSVAKEAVRKKDSSLPVDDATGSVIDDFDGSKIVVIRFARGAGAGVAVRKSDCTAVDVDLNWFE
jgi:hypothetical protein